MNSPLDFLRVFRVRLREAGIRFALTSGMACVEYGLQQSTKDTDWIIAPDDLGKLRTLFAGLEAASPGCRVMYRSLFGAPLDFEFLSHGWTSHLLVRDPDGAEHKVDIFGVPPRLASWTADDTGLATRHVVAQMKKTDREKDWPMVDSIAWQLWEHRSSEALLHIQDQRKLIDAWGKIPPADRHALAQKRPLLRLLDHEKNPDRVFAAVRIERIIWACVDEVRYGSYKQAWKTFYRAWKKEPGWQWPVDEPFSSQHQRLLDAASRHELAKDPVGHDGREALLDRAMKMAEVRSNSDAEKLGRITPPVSELWP
ncbi:MAG: hypothetical protein HY360_20240 [Verrucomicrobia bacterium]|nr:hypothetical protein [Verrucomicrobiota bacterium]